MKGPEGQPSARPSAAPEPPKQPARPPGLDRPPPSRGPARTAPRPVDPPERPTAAQRPSATRPAGRGERPAERGSSRAAKNRKARLALKRVDPWSVFVFSLVAAVFLAVALVVAVAVLYNVLDRLGVLTSVNDLFREVTGGEAGEPLLSGGRIIGGAAVLGAVNVVLLTLLATLGALLYNLCASFTGGIEVTLGEREN